MGGARARGDNFIGPGTARVRRNKVPQQLSRKLLARAPTSWAGEQQT